MIEHDILFNEIRTIVANILELDEEEINGEISFIEDLEVDSMIALEILVAIEKRFKIKIPEERLLNITNLNGSVALAKELIEG